MSEPVSSTSLGALAWKLGLWPKLLALLATGVVGAALVASFNPPPSRRVLFFQALCAGVVSMLFTAPALRVLAAAFPSLGIQGGGDEQWLEYALATGFVLGALSWGMVGFLSKLRDLLKTRAAALVESKLLNGSNKGAEGV